MPTKYTQPHVVVVSQNEGGHLTITLELNINLNSNGIQASVTASTPETTKEKEFEFMIPEFESQQIEFGKEVHDV